MEREPLRWILLDDRAPARFRHALQAHSRGLRRSQPLQNSRCREAERIPIRKFLRSDVEGIESVGAVGAVFEQVLFALGEFLTHSSSFYRYSSIYQFAGLILAEAVATSADTG